MDDIDGKQECQSSDGRTIQPAPWSAADQPCGGPQRKCYCALLTVALLRATEAQLELGIVSEVNVAFTFKIHTLAARPHAGRIGPSETIRELGEVRQA